jgi:hypothetical protein
MRDVGVFSEAQFAKLMDARTKRERVLGVITVLYRISNARRDQWDSQNYVGARLSALRAPRAPRKKTRSGYNFDYT